MHLLWFCLLIPALLCGVLIAVPKWRVMTKWWELAIPFVVACITIAICQWVAVSSAVNDKEYWGNMTYSAVMEEPLSYDGECSEQYACGQT